MSSSSVSKRRGGKKMPTKIPAGDILTDSSKRDWIIQSSIGKGGFGEIYTASSSYDPTHQNFVIKIEPSDSGPLFCEKTVYIRIGKAEDIAEYKKSKNLLSVGMPTFFGSGIHSVNGKKFRFLVLERYGKDLWTIFLEENRIFPPATVFKIGIQVLHVLEYIHSKGYVHADIKGANLLLGRGLRADEVFLVDFGLAARYTNQFKPDPRRAHNGTLEYISLDGHDGIVTRRGDIETLGYNLLQWLSSNLPWEGLKDLHEVQAKKINFMKDIKLLLKSCFKNKRFPSATEKYFECLAEMEPLGEPDYKKLQQIMKEGIRITGDVSPKLEFHHQKTASKGKTKEKISPVPVKVCKANDGTRRRAATSRPKSNATIDILESSSEEDIIESTPEKKTKLISGKNCPSAVSCAELHKNDKSVKRCRRNK